MTIDRESHDYTTARYAGYCGAACPVPNTENVLTGWSEGVDARNRSEVISAPVESPYPKDMSEAKRMIDQWRSRALAAEAKLCRTCNGHGAVGNVINAEPCPECTPQSFAFTNGGISCNRDFDIINPTTIQLKEPLA